MKRKVEGGERKNCAKLRKRGEERTGVTGAAPAGDDATGVEAPGVLGVRVVVGAWRPRCRTRRQTRRRTPGVGVARGVVAPEAFGLRSEPISGVGAPDSAGDFGL